MPTRLLHFRFTFAILGVIALLTGAVLESFWLAGPGAAAAAVSDLIGLLQSRARFKLPVERTLRGGAEALPALAVAAYEPYAIGVTIAVVLYALMANGMETVKAAKGDVPARRGAETIRRVVTALVSVSLLWIPLAPTTSFDFAGQTGVNPTEWTSVAFLILFVLGMVVLLDSLRSVRAKTPETQGNDAQNVDT